VRGTDTGKPVLWPNPWRGADPLFLRCAASDAGPLDAHLYTLASRRVRSWKGLTVPTEGGDIALGMGEAGQGTLANGLYYLKLRLTLREVLLPLAVVR
jgi:hypothetical protein